MFHLEYEIPRLFYTLHRYKHFTKKCIFKMGNLLVSNVFPLLDSTTEISLQPKYKD